MENRLKNKLLLDAALGHPTDRVPVWVMRQAGRILPEYRKLREKYSFKELVKKPELSTKVTLQPVKRFEVDAAIMFSDILVLPEAMGVDFQIDEKKGPTFERPIRSISDVATLKSVDLEDRLEYVYEGIRLTKIELTDRIPLIGFAGAPWTIFSYIVEGGGSKTFSTARKMLYREPKFSNALLEKITEATIHYLKGQIKAGVNIVQLFDSWAGILTSQQYKHVILPYLRRIIDELNNPEVPLIMYAKGLKNSAMMFNELKCNVIGLDWYQSPEHAKRLTAQIQSLQGNLDPAVLYCDRKDIIKHTHSMLLEFGKNRYIANLGHGVYSDTPYENVQCFIDTIKDFRW